MYIKVDFSIKRKSAEGFDGMPGEFAIYTKKHWWDKWTEGRTYADPKWAFSDAQKLRDLDLPKYF